MTQTPRPAVADTIEADGNDQLRELGYTPELERTMSLLDVVIFGLIYMVPLAAVAVLEHLGFSISITTQRVCCGLTWVSTGQLDGAKRQLRRSLAALTQATATAAAANPQFQAEIPIGA